MIFLIIVIMCVLTTCVESLTRYRHVKLVIIAGEIIAQLNIFTSFMKLSSGVSHTDTHTRACGTRARPRERNTRIHV